MCFVRCVLKTRVSKVMQLKLCFRCLKGKHQASQCTHKYPRLCQKCNRGHNYMLHDDSHGNYTSTDGSRGTGQVTSNNDKDKDKAKTNTEFTDISESLDTTQSRGHELSQRN